LATADQTASEILTLIEDGVDSVHYKDASIDAEHLAADAVITAKILNANVTTAKIADDAVTADKLAANAVVNASVAASAAITFAKLEPLDSTKILVGNASNVATEVAVSGDVTMANTGAVTIAADAVTYAKIQNVSATNVLLGRDSANAGIIEEISVGNVRTMLNVADGATAYTDSDAVNANATLINNVTVSALNNLNSINAITAKASKCFVYLSGNQTVSAGPNKVTHDTALWNVGSNYDTTNKYYVAPRDGYYLVACSYYFTSAPTWAMSLIYVDENAGAGFAIRLRRHSVNGQDTHLSAVIKLSANDKVAHYAQTSTNGTIGAGLNTLTYFQVTEML